ncbi:hypothetical protein AB0B86_27880 [Micromonospora sp. NPDC049047]|uniref:hypothetical protein n=1 Tax=Micromonospora sp. NPDC049047 TaxID=3155645 RepID=UPI0033F792E5
MNVGEVRKHRLVRALIALVAFLGLGVVTAAVPASPALAACSGAGCYNVNPDGQCSGTRYGWTGGGYDSGLGIVVVKSPGCKAAWARLQNDQYLRYNGGTFTVRIERRVWSSYGYWYTGSLSKQFPSTHGGVWTNMLEDLDSWDEHQACFNFLGGAWTCTPWIS